MTFRRSGLPFGKALLLTLQAGDVVCVVFHPAFPFNVLAVTEMAKVFNPRSMPTALSWAGSGAVRPRRTNRRRNCPRGHVGPSRLDSPLDRARAALRG